MKWCLSIIIIVSINFYGIQADAAKKSRFYYEKKGDIVWEVPMKDEKLIALTFDDGPDPKYTPTILNLLQKYGAKATFL